MDLPIYRLTNYLWAFVLSSVFEELSRQMNMDCRYNSKPFLVGSN
jgi:hypothetical protein